MIDADLSDDICGMARIHEAPSNVDHKILVHGVMHLRLASDAGNDINGRRRKKSVLVTEMTRGSAHLC